MADPAQRLMTTEEFLNWCLTQDQKWELVDGVPVLKDVVDPMTGMTGASRRHDRIVTNIIIALGNRLRGGPCQPTTDDIAVETRAGQRIRRPDVTIDCGQGRDDDMQAAEPVAVFEVLSPSTRQTDLVRKLDEYRALGSLQHIAFIEQVAADLTVWSRDAAGIWQSTVLQGLDGQIELGDIEVSLPLAEIYADVAFDPAAG